MNKLLRVRQLVPLLASLLAPIALLPGQTISGRAVIATPKSSVRVGGVMDRVDGVWAGLALDFRVGRFTLSGGGMRGQLTPSQAGTAPKRDVGELSLDGQYEFRPWLHFGLQYTARAFSSAAGYQRWDIVGVGAAGSRDLGTPAVRAAVGLTWLPVVRVRGQEAPTFALRSDVGLSVAPIRFPLAFTLGYRVERFRFSKSAIRSEQFEALTLSVGVRARRVAGRWTLGGGVR
jgi:hypothetical protein